MGFNSGLKGLIRARPDSLGT